MHSIDFTKFDETLANPISLSLAIGGAVHIRKICSISGFCLKVLAEILKRFFVDLKACSTFSIVPDLTS